MRNAEFLTCRNRQTSPVRNSAVFDRLIAVAGVLAAAALPATQGHAGETALGPLLLSESALRDARSRAEALQPVAYAAEPTREPGYGIAAAEVLGFQYLLNRFDNAFVGDEYNVSGSSIRRNLRRSWVEDQDPFAINQIGHPYQGSMYYGFARSAGIGFWGSFAYTFAGSAVWEIAGETTPPSRNDQFTTSLAGTFLGESLYRLANLVLEQGPPGMWRELAAAAISPPTGLNRHLFPDRFGAILNSRNPALFSRLQLGASGTLKSDVGPSTELKRNEAIADYLLEYGMPGKPGYQYERPFDYFSFQARASSVRGIESIHNRGLILGVPYGAGDRYRGVWGLYGSYDYLSPQLFRLSSTALSLGTTGTWRPGPAVAIHGTVTAGAGFTSTNTVRAVQRDNNYGFAPQMQVSLRMTLADAISFDVSARKYFAGRIAEYPAGGKDRVLRADASLTYRVRDHHAISLKYISSRRETALPPSGDRSQRRDTLGIYYTYLPDAGFGGARW